MKALWAKQFTVVRELISEEHLDYLDLCRKSAILDIYTQAKQNGWHVVDYHWRYQAEEDIYDPVTREPTGDKRVTIQATVEYTEEE